ncbi:AAA family ATPase [Candidatus Nomurabacteria bacterium]|uniref:AAA family ATPase n=1 Tax=candidate division WWE3 bacterium TaxID=2053526 RepID=A0A955E0J1_UNCKA|nr:AAA family ATPase [candidate division WWE3 bacterium]MCB9824065.1 AAA family ATPase [Candidatus Nomurabacteria bacterium]MCB9826964.1 AAA family ATPase [Candidatus Nomurabacteria bacterium]MCB9828006.1 AAA family ATPase [Candidatus Nomurabacteria bacterium]
MNKELIRSIAASKNSLIVGLAGPGTGKSYTFKEIVLSEDYKGKKILILSFINKLVDDLKDDFEKFENVEVSTLHAFAYINMGEVLLNENLDKYISEDYKYIFGSDINYAEKFYQNALTEEEETFYFNRSAYYRYDRDLYSFNSIIYKFNQLMNASDSNIPRYDLILIDEFQDFNSLEVELIQLLNKVNKVVVVGDDDQSLYAFKKAKPDKIRDLYRSENTYSFSLDNCYRCPKVIVDATNNLVKNAVENNYLQERENAKKFLYPEEDPNHTKKHEVSEKYPKIYFAQQKQGDLLTYSLVKFIKDDVTENDGGRVLVICPRYLMNSIYDGLTSKGLNVIDFELFSSEEKNKIKHSELIKALEILSTRKTDNLALRQLLNKYVSDDFLKESIKSSHTENKKLWSYLVEDTRTNIEEDVTLFKKVRKGKDDLTETDLLKLNQLFNLKNILSKMINGFNAVKKGAIEVELTTTVSSKGLSAEFVYYLAIDDSDMLDRDTGTITDNKLCEFLVGMTRAKSKLVLISRKDAHPKILEFLDDSYIETI